MVGTPRRLVIIFSIAILSAILGFLAGVASARTSRQATIIYEQDNSGVMRHASDDD